MTGGFDGCLLVELPALVLIFKVYLFPYVYVWLGTITRKIRFKEQQ